MKSKFLSSIISAVVCAGVAVSTAFSVAAETISVEPVYPIHGNKCCTYTIVPELDRAIYVTITQNTEDGDYEYYNYVIPAGGEDVGQNDYSFLLEGKNDVSYTMTVGVPKYKGSDDAQIFTYEFVVADPDFITEETVNGYMFSLSVARNDELEEPEITSSTEQIKDENNNIVSSMTVSFPLSDIIPGDIDFNERVDLYDAIGIAKYLLDKSYFNEAQVSAGDYNLDEAVNLYDIIDIAKSLM